MEAQRRYYECIAIIHSGIDASKKFDNLISTIKEHDEGSKITRLENIGSREFAYPIERHAFGRYFLVNFHCVPKAQLAFEDIMRTDSDVVRHMTIKTDSEITEPSELCKEGIEEGDDQKDVEAVEIVDDIDSEIE